MYQNQLGPSGGIYYPNFVPCFVVLYLNSNLINVLLFGAVKHKTIVFYILIDVHLQVRWGNLSFKVHYSLYILYNKTFIIHRITNE